MRLLLAVMVVLAVGVGCKGPKGERGSDGASGQNGPSGNTEVQQFDGTADGNPTLITVGPWDSAILAVYYSDTASPNDWRQVETIPVGSTGAAGRPYYLSDSAMGEIFLHDTPNGFNYRIYIIPVTSLSARRGIASVYGE